MFLYYQVQPLHQRKRGKCHFDNCIFANEKLKRKQKRTSPKLIEFFYPSLSYDLAATWYGKTRVTSYELRVENLKARVEIQSCEFELNPPVSS